MSTRAFINLKPLVAPTIRGLASRHGMVTLRLRRGVKVVPESELPIEETPGVGVGGLSRLSQQGAEYEEHQVRALVQSSGVIALERQRLGYESGLYQVRIIDGERDLCVPSHTFGGALPNSSSRGSFVLYPDDEVVCELGGEQVTLVVRGVSNHSHQAGYYVYDCVLKERQG